MTALQWLILIFAVFVLSPVVLEMYRNWDYRRQVAGRRPPRKFRGTKMQSQNQPNPRMEAEKYIAELKARQNFFGPE